MMIKLENHWTPYHPTPRRTLVLPGDGWRQRASGEPIVAGDYIRNGNWFHRVQDGYWTDHVVGQVIQVACVWSRDRARLCDER